MAERGGRLRGRPAALLALAALAGCNYSFTGGSFPDHIRTIAIVPFENETTRIELQSELHEILLRELPRSLGIRPGGEDVADALLRGRIVGYTVTTPSYTPSPGGDRAQVNQREVTLVVAVEIVDRVLDEIYWEDRGIRASGQYLESEGETEDIGKQEAIELLVAQIVDGAQSTW